MSGIFTPINQVKLTNVSIVRLKKGGKRFELACYKNKVMEYRNKITKNLDQVLQSEFIFANVSKGQVASNEDLQSCFKSLDKQAIVLEILVKGELQVSEKERAGQSDSLQKEIATIVADKCVNPETKRPYTVSLIEKAMADAHFSVSLSKNAKQQALELIKLLQKKNAISISRALMKVLVHLPLDCLKIKDQIIELFDTKESETFDDQAFEAVGLIQPGAFKEISALVLKFSKGKGVVHILSLKDVAESETIA